MTILRDSTNQRHRQVEALPLIQDLLHGRMDAPGYARYLAELAEIYCVLEDLAEQAEILVGLPGIHRTQKIRADVQELDPGLVWTVGHSTQRYIRYLRDLYHETDLRHLLLAHVYVRHMGDLYGGKLLARAVPGSGLAYEFDDRPALIREFNQRLYPELAHEANRAFDWFISIFQELGSRLGPGPETGQALLDVAVEIGPQGLAGPKHD